MKTIINNSTGIEVQLTGGGCFIEDPRFNEISPNSVTAVSGTFTNLSATILNVGPVSIPTDLKSYPFSGSWEDLQGTSTTSTAGATALTFEELGTTGFLMYFMRHDQNETLYFKYQMSQRWDEKTAVRPHLHVMPMSAPVSVVDIGWQSCWVPLNGVVPTTTANWTTGSVSFTVSSSMQFSHKLIRLERSHRQRAPGQARCC